jgi:hypothetical protein
MPKNEEDKKAIEEAIQKAIALDPSIASASRPWQKFLAKFAEIETIKTSQWKEVHVLAYISKRFEGVFGRKFAVAMSGAPSKSPDVFMIKQIIATLQTTNMRTVKEFIDWTFDTKIIPNKIKIRKLGFFINPGLANEFLFHKKDKSIVKRSTELPSEYKCIASQLGIDANTYGDLAFIKMASDRARGDLNNPYLQLLINLEAVGFETIILERLAE